MTYQDDDPYAPKKTAGPTLVKSWLIAGTADMAGAMIWNYFYRDTPPLNILTYIGRTVLGKDRAGERALEQIGWNEWYEWYMRFEGLIFHYSIAFGWTYLFYALWPRLKFMQENKIVTAAIYGAFIWIVMNLAIVPLRTGKWIQNPDWINIGVNVLILALAFGVTLSFMIGGYYEKRNLEAK
ncbi:MAG TPA: hypothetical protein VKH37_08420 [Ferruginibacter sp.]|nr:hypothetical protein [Ferruginibacter sp.]